MSTWRLRIALFCALSSVACGPTKRSIPLRSLEGSGRASFICWGADDAPRNIEDCPDKIPYELDHENRHWISLVTQTTRGEVAVVDLTDGTVLDEEPTVPGYNFLPVGESPVSIVSTPGSVASFVAVAEVGKEGIFGLPTSCVAPRQQNAQGEPLRDLLTWPACRLPSPPGEMALLIDPATSGGVRQSCDATTRVPADEPAGPGATRAECPADLAQETKRPGRRKLAVTLPERGEVAIIDAQGILDRTPGSFDPCPIERYVRLGIDLPSQPIVQKPPSDFAMPGCPALPANVPPPPAASEFFPRPAGMAQDPSDQSGRLYVADRDAPVVHVLSAKDPCAITEEPPLLPVSFVDPSRIVTTSRVSLSPPTSRNQRYLYAVDELDGGSVMMFDVSEGSTDRTPIVRPRSPLMPYEPEPDRIAFDAPTADVTFAQTDQPVVDPVTGSQAFASVECDPDPRNSSTPGARYRPVGDSTTGAQPAVLRGVFGFLALSSGQVAVVDVEDLDSRCRRPVAANPSSTEDFRGCSGDDPAISSFETSTGPTVTDERTCHVAEAHRSRSVVLIENTTTAVRSPSLLALPKLIDVVGRTLATDRSVDGARHPRMLGVDFSPTTPAEVYVGTNLHGRVLTDHPLPIDPAVATESSLVLNLQEPRSYARPEDFSATYEGRLMAERPAARFQVDPATGGATLKDSGIAFCGVGVEDEAVATERAQDLGVAAASAPAFGQAHSDYVVITSDILDRNDDYWKQGPGASCGGVTQPGASFLQCRAQLGTRDVPLELRELRVVKATADVLELEPRHARTASEIRQINDLISCCFPGTVSYDLRASSEWVVSGSGSGIRHKIVTGAGGACVRDRCDPLKSRLESRVFEVSCADPAGCNLDAQGNPSIGAALPGEVGCILPAGFNGPVQPTLGRPGTPTALDRCIFDGLTARFVIYRGVSAPPAAGEIATTSSERDMVFVWQVRGAFTPWTISLGVSDANTSPQSIQFSPYAGELVLTDAADQGLVVMSLSNLVPHSYF